MATRYQKVKWKTDIDKSILAVLQAIKHPFRLVI